MPYTSNKHMPRIRRDAADLIRRGWSTRKVARHFGFSQSVVVKWVQKAKRYGHVPIPTLSSRPHRHPKQLSSELVWKIFHRRLLIKRSAEVVHQELVKESKYQSPQ
jgi:transposase